MAGDRPYTYDRHNDFEFPSWPAAQVVRRNHQKANSEWPESLLPEAAEDMFMGNVTRFKKITGAAATVTMVAALAACGSSDADSEDGVTKIRAWGTPSSTALSVWVAQEQGYFEEEGLEVDMELGTDQTIALQSLGSQKEIVFNTTPVLFSALNRKFPVKVVSGMVNHSDTHPGCGTVVSTKPVKSALDLQGKRVGVTTLTSIIPLSMHYVIDAQGGDAESVKLVQVNFPMLDQLEAGNVDAVLATAPYWNMAESDPDLHIGPDLCLDAVKEATDGEVNSSPTGIYVANEQWASDNAEAIDGWRAALAKAGEWIAANDAEARVLMAEKLDLEQELADITALPEFASEVDEEDFRGPLEIAKTMGLLDDRPDLEASDFLFDN